MCTEEVIEEIEALTAILEEDKVDLVKENDIIKEVYIHLTPLTASQEDRQYVSLTLVIQISKDYPSVPPNLEVKNPRGLEDSAVEVLLQRMKLRCEEYIECPVLFELIELGREFLTERNVPVCQCCICLNNIQEEDSFLKTECLHFFHQHCLGRYITSVKKDYKDEVKRIEKENKHSTIKAFALLCPVCRENIDNARYNAEELLTAAMPVAGEGQLVISITDEVKDLQAQMQKLFLKQKQNGGIIDLEEEGRKYLVLTGSNDDSSQESQEYTELSPTDFNPPSSIASPSRRNPTPQSPRHNAPPPLQQRGNRGNTNWRGGRGGYNRNNGREGTDQGGQRGKSHHQMRKLRGPRGGGAKGDGAGAGEPPMEGSKGGRAPVEGGKGGRGDKKLGRREGKQL